MVFPVPVFARANLDYHIKKLNKNNAINSHVDAAQYGLHCRRLNLSAVLKGDVVQQHL